MRDMTVSFDPTTLHTRLFIHGAGRAQAEWANYRLFYDFSGNSALQSMWNAWETRQELTSQFHNALRAGL